MKHSPRQSKLGRIYRGRFDNPAHDSFHGEGYSNFGFWERTTSPGEHGDQLVDRLLGLLPSRTGKVLDVACGQGGTTRRLTTYFAAEDITAINLFEDQLDVARKLAPGCTFLQMDATQLTFSDETFDVVVCVEAAHHFETREEFLLESARVLKRGGHLLLSDLLFTEENPTVPRENVVSATAYEELFKRIGLSPPTSHEQL